MAIVALQPRQRLSDTIYQSLRWSIVRAEMPPGSRIAEGEICERLRVSRTPVREALLRLADEGLVEVFPQSGMYVTPVRVAAVSEAQFIREHLEIAIIREMAMVADEAGVATLRAIVKLQEAAQKARDLNAFYEQDERLHEQFCTLAGKNRVWQVIQNSKLHLDRVRWLSLPAPKHIPHLIRQHRAVIDAVAARDPDAAETTLRVHLREVYATIAGLGLPEAEGETRIASK